MSGTGFAFAISFFGVHSSAVKFSVSFHMFVLRHVGLLVLLLGGGVVKVINVGGA